MLAFEMCVAYSASDDEKPIRFFASVVLVCQGVKIVGIFSIMDVEAHSTFDANEHYILLWRSVTETIGTSFKTLVWIICDNLPFLSERFIVSPKQQEALCVGLL